MSKLLSLAATGVLGAATRPGHGTDAVHTHLTELSQPPRREAAGTCRRWDPSPRSRGQTTELTGG